MATGGLSGMKAERHVVVVGAGVGGLMAALILAGSGLRVTVLERAATPGGKMRQRFDQGLAMDAGPTVFTLKRIFEEAFASVGLDFDACAPSRRASVLARHAWDDRGRFDLFADVDRSADEVARFFSKADADGFRRFAADSARVWRTLERSFVRAPAPRFSSLVRGAGLGGLSDLLATRPFQTLWNALGDYFPDPRLRQLFGRYATYCGSSPFQCPATLMLVAHVEQDGVWMIDGGMHRLAQTLAEQAAAKGACVHYGAHVERIATSRSGAQVELASGEVLTADAVVYNGDVSALGQGLLGDAVRKAAPATAPEKRSLSAITWTLAARTRDFPLVRHNVFFSQDYSNEFDAVRRGGLIDDPTVYVCAQDRGDDDDVRDSPERLLMLVNAPATGDRRALSHEELATCAARTMDRLTACGLRLENEPTALQATAPQDFEALFPATGGALYGRASHGWAASFQRPGMRSKAPRLYLAGGSVHPGPGVPMAALSGWTAANCVMADLASMRLSPVMGTRGGISTPSTRTASTA